jgi:hypothetical protein
MNRQTATSFALIALLFSGCATILPGNDPVVVNAERVTTIALATMDSFLQIEYLNRAQLLKVSPAIHAYAEYIRHNGVNFLDTARALTLAYKNNRTTANAATLNTAIAVLQSISTQSQLYLNSPNMAPLAPSPTPAPTP